MNRKSNKFQTSWRSLCDFVVKHALFFQILLSIVLGIVAGLVFDMIQLQIVHMAILLSLFGLIIIITLILIIYATEISKLFKDHVKEISEIVGVTNQSIRDVSEKTKNYIDDVLSGGLIIQSQRIELIISDETMKKGCCDICHTIDMYNPNPDRVYKDYMFKVISALDEDSLGCNDESFNPKYRVFRNTEKDENEICITDDRKKFEKIINVNPNNPPSESKTKYIYSMSIPVNVEKSGFTRCIIREYNCQSFNSFMVSDTMGMNEYKTEYISNRVSYPTDRIEFHVRLNNLSNYNLKEICTSHDSGFSVSYIISDHSDVLDLEYMRLVSKRGYVPKLSSDGQLLKWEVPNPKIGCRYKLSFTISK